MSVRRAIAECFPHYVHCKDLTVTRGGREKGNCKPKVLRRQSRRIQDQAAGVALHAAPTVTRFTPASRLRHSPQKCRMPALYAFASSVMLQANQAND
eukprot:1089829-Rhodomonas_salina.1